MYSAEIVNDYRCGKHSNFPLCCNLAYSIGDNLSELKNLKYFRYRRLFNKIVERLRHIQFGYIPCPICVIFAYPNEVMKCNCRYDQEIMNNRKKLRTSKNVEAVALLSKQKDKINKIMNILLDEPFWFSY